MAQLLIIGGSDAGISAALRAREVDPRVSVLVIVADSFPNYSICGIPFYISGEVPDWRRLAHRTVDEIERAGIRLLLDHRATTIDTTRKTVEVVDTGGQIQTLAYDRLVIATGAEAIHPDVAGWDLPGVHVLHTMEDSFRVYQQVMEGAPQNAVIVGAGYIGMEMVDAFRRRGLQVSLVVRSGVLRTTIDASLAPVVEDELRRHGVEVIKGVDVESIQRDGSRLIVSGSHGFKKSTDMVLTAAGVRPQSELAKSAGIATGVKGAIQVNSEMMTNIPGIFAAGDCVETWHRVTRQNSYLPLGTTAHKQGRIAGENASGGQRQFAGSLGTQIIKVFDLVVARTGLLDSEALHAGFDPSITNSTAWDHKAYYPNARELSIRITGDRRSGRLLGAQMVGHWQSEVAKRIDIFATAIFHEMNVEDLNDLDLSYTPPLSSPWDPVQMSAQEWTLSMSMTSKTLNNKVS